MVQDISRLTGQTVANTSLQRGGSKPVQTDKAAGNNSVAQDAVSLTEQAQGLQKMAASQTGEAYDSAKIQQLKSAIENGEYKVNAEQLASKLASFEADLL